MPRARSVLGLVILAPLLVLLGQQPLAAQVRASAGITIEAESLVGSAQVTHGKVMPQNMQPFGPGWSGGSQLFWAGAQVGAELNLTFPIGAAGRYEFFVHFTRAPDYALVRASFDGAPFVSFNGYAPTVSRDRALVAMRDLTPGTHALLLKVMSKDSPSQGLNVGIDRIELAPVSGSAPASPSRNTATGRNPAGAMTEAVGASMVEGAMPRVPVVHIPPMGKTPQPMMIQGVEPLSMADRLSVTQQATSLPLTGALPPIRLSASNSRVLKKAYLNLSGGYLASDQFTEGSIGLPPNAFLSVSYRQLEAKRPHLLDCGVHLNEPAEIKLSAYVDPNTYGPQLHKQTLPKGSQRLIVVLVPDDPDIYITIAPAGAVGFSIRYCELTPFK